MSQPGKAISDAPAKTAKREAPLLKPVSKTEKQAIRTIRRNWTRTGAAEISGPLYELIESGWSQRALAKVIGKSESRVRQIIHSHKTTQLKGSERPETRSTHHETVPQREPFENNPADTQHPPSP